ncbi:MAG: BTAD domain-containing putative transcriptional regulator, partial [Acidimicrobiia bacterium]
MEFRILGPLQVIGAVRPAAVGGSRERTLLARLLVSANQVVSSERLLVDVWEGDPPEGASRALPVYVSRLRKVLRAAGIEEAILTQPPGYVLRLEPGHLDAVRFEALVVAGRRRAVSADPEGAAGILREALALWRGPALADVADVPFARGEAARLEEARLTALEERIDADLACGRHAELVGELGTLVSAHPLRERPWGQRMLALYRSGRQAEALRAYQELRGILGEELGIEPSTALTRLETAILRHEEELDRRLPEPGAPLVPSAAAPAPPGAEPQPFQEAPDHTAPGVVAFLFTDVVGSTELFQQLGDDAAEEVRRGHFRLVRDAVAAHGGTEVKTLGDGVMVAFTSPLAAIRCAVALQQTIERDNRRRATTLAVRVGLHAGEPISHEDDYFGTPVVVAKRLCDRAEGGQILASALVRALVGRRGDHAFRDLGPMSLKGLDEPVTACEVAWSPLAPGVGALPLP